MKKLAFAVPDFFIEALSRGGAYFARMFLQAAETSVENAIRGRFIAPRFGSVRMVVGRHVIFSSMRNIDMGNHVTIHAGCQIVAGKHGSVRIGSHSHVARNSVLAGGGDISIGEHCSISGGVAIYSSTYQRAPGELLRDAETIRARVEIGDDVHIGANATILPGVSIGANSTIGAGAVVTKSCPAGSVLVGVPAGPVRSREIPS